MLTHYNLINKLCFFSFLIIASPIWAQINAACTPYDYFDSSHSSACISLKNQISTYKINPERSIYHKKIKAAVSEFLASPKSLQDAFPQLPHDIIQQNHLEFPAWQLIIDKSIHHIFNLKSLRNENYLCKGIPLVSDQLALQLGISDSLARKIHDQCREMSPRGSGSYFGNQLGTKFYVFVKLNKNLTEGDYFPFTGWTDEANTTYLFIRPSTTWGDLELALIHELAVGMDSKGLHGMVQFVSAYPTASVPEDSTVGDEWPLLFYISQLPEIRYTFVTMRANRVMKMAFDEVNKKQLNYESKNKKFNPITEFFKKYSYNEDLESRRESLVGEFKNLVKQTKTWETPLASSDSPMRSIMSVSLDKIRNKFPHIKTLEDALNAIIKSKTKVLLYSGGPEVDFLTYMSMPLFGQKSVQNFLSHGPGCGYCGGSNKEEEIEKWNRFWDQAITLEPIQSRGNNHE